MIKALHTFPFLRPLVTAHGEGTGTSRIPGEMTRYGFCENSGKGVGCHRRGNDGADPVMSPFHLSRMRLQHIVFCFLWRSWQLCLTAPQPKGFLSP